MQIIDGGVCAAKGFVANGIHAGIRKNKDKKDLALIYTKTKASVACVYTQNLVKGAPIAVTKDNVRDGYAHAIICNSGNANTCNKNGEELALKICELVSYELRINKKDVVVASTGVIGQVMSIEPFENGMKELVLGLKENNSSAANQAIMTTDTVEKSIAVEFEIDGKKCHIGGIAKGSGMINPNMATMLVFITSDVAINPSLLQKALSNDILDTFNMISVDGDTSTNDMVTVMANGEALNTEITEENSSYFAFQKALNLVTSNLCRKIAQDGEGATKVLECIVSHAKTKEIARKVSKTVIQSSLLKAAMFGSDANWGRVLCAIGYSKCDVDINLVDVKFASLAGEILVCESGRGVMFSEEIAKKILLEKSIKILIDLNDGKFEATAYGCDLTYDYVRINGDYRS